MPRRSQYPPIGDYALIADCHSAALVSRRASIDWCCMPRFDSGSCFGRLLDWKRAGYCSITPAAADFECFRRYVDGTLVLETTFRTGGGEVRVTDCFTMRRGGRDNPHRQVLRVVEGVRGAIELRLEIVPRFDYGEVRPWIRLHGLRLHSAIGGNDGLLISTDADLAVFEEHGLAGDVVVRAGERVHLSLQYVHPEEMDPDPPESPDPGDLDRRIEETIKWWRRWSSRGRLESPDGPAAIHSAVVLKSLVHSPTGAMAAAATTSPSREGRRRAQLGLPVQLDPGLHVRAALAGGAGVRRRGGGVSPLHRTERGRQR